MAYSRVSQSQQSRYATVRFPRSVPSTDWIDFAMPEGDRFIVLPVRLNSEPVEAILDSGAGVTALDPILLPKLGLKANHNLHVTGVSGIAAGAMAEGLTIAIGKALLAVPEVAVLDLKPLHVATARPVLAILGQDVFGPLFVDIDFEHKRIAFHDPAAAVAPSGAFPIPLTLGQFGRRAVSISIEGKPPIPALLDLGNDTPLCLSHDYVRRMGLFQGRRSSHALSIGVEGIEESLVTVAATAAIGATVIPDVPVEIPKRWMGDFPAIVGMPLLSRFRLSLDFGRGLIWVLPHRDAKSRPFKKDRLGFAAIPAGDCLKVVYISPDSPAALAGLKAGDEIVVVDGQKIDEIYFKARPHQGLRPAGTHIRFLLRTGKTIDATLADYF